MAFLAALHLGDATAACDPTTRHAPLAAAWTAHQQGAAFQSALQVFQNREPFTYEALRAAMQMWLLAVSNNLPHKQQQLHELLMALLGKDRLPDAHKEVPQALWDAVCTAYQHSGDEGGLSQAWHWMQQQQQGGAWAPSDPACYISTAHALTAQGHPLEGARMLRLYHEEAYAPPLLVSDCDTFLQLCKAGEQAGGSLADSLSAALSLLHHMKQTSLPAPAVTTCALATHCLLAQLTDGVPAHQVLVQLQQEVWHDMQKETAAGAHESAAYLPALSVFDGTEAVQTVLLMAQNNVSGLSGDACLALVLLMEDDQLAWMRQVFSAKFMDELETMAESASQSTTQSAWLGFPDCPVPRLSVVQLTADIAYFEVAGGETPLWMVPMAAWQHGRMPVKSVAEQLQPPSEQVTELSAAEQLAADYGHLERGSKSKRRK
ncbi:hypothetical protein ABBQ32_010414 [Trebouxia sp. C0010 RCD-2024]